MTGFSVPRLAVPASVLQTDGQRRRGHIFVGERMPTHTGHETPLEMLNRPEGFFPFRPDGEDAVLLVTKARTITLSVPHDTADDDPDRLSAAKLTGVSLALADGSQLTGWAVFELPQHHSRLLDYLNSSPDPFFAVSTDAEIHFVNRAHVLYAQPED
jgi:hypothetical protein